MRSLHSAARARALPRSLGVAALLLGGCGALAPEGNPVGELPSSGAGPYHTIDEPERLLADPAASLDDPLLVADPTGPGFTLHYSRRGDDGAATIERARFTSLLDGAPVRDTELAADQPWEGGAVAQPALLPLDDGGALLCYATGPDGAGRAQIGCALSQAGGPFRKAAGPARRAGASSLASPALLALDGQRLRLIVLGDEGRPFSVDATRSAAIATGGAALFEGPAVALVFDGGAAPPLARTTARTVETSTGRRRFELFTTRPGAVRSLRFAASFDGAHFTTAATPLLPVAAPEEWSPSVSSVAGGGALLVYVRSPGRRSALYPARAP